MLWWCRAPIAPVHLSPVTEESATSKSRGGIVRMPEKLLERPGTTRGFHLMPIAVGEERRKMAKFAKPRLLSEREINVIRGKAIVGRATPAELMSVFAHWDLMEAKMDEVERDDFFGTEGWRHFFGLPDAD